HAARPLPESRQLQLLDCHASREFRVLAGIQSLWSHYVSLSWSASPTTPCTRATKKPLPLTRIRVEAIRSRDQFPKKRGEPHHRICFDSAILSRCAVAVNSFQLSDVSMPALHGRRP